MTKKVYKYAFCGTHGTGKSSGATYLAALLKQRFPGKSVKVIEENVREISRLFYDKLDNPDFQKLLITDMASKELTYSQIYDIIISDRSLIDSVIYSKIRGVNLDIEFERFAEEWLRCEDTRYDEIFFVRPDCYKTKPGNDGYRDLDIDFRNKIDEEFYNRFALLNIIYKEIKTSEIFNFPYLQILDEIQ